MNHLELEKTLPTVRIQYDEIFKINGNKKDLFEDHIVGGADGKLFYKLSFSKYDLAVDEYIHCGSELAFYFNQQGELFKQESTGFSDLEIAILKKCYPADFVIEIFTIELLEFTFELHSNPKNFEYRVYPDKSEVRTCAFDNCEFDYVEDNILYQIY